ncbi:MAG: hypothetical protein AAB671_01105 [Patescibacteria group bacterium]
MDNQVRYFDLGCGERETLFFFLLNAYLQSRIETSHESDGDEEVNMYIAGLLYSLVHGEFYAENAGRLAVSPADVCEKAEQSGTACGKAAIYRANADHRFVAFGLFAGFGDHVSRYRRAVTDDPSEANLEHAQQFYVWAACHCARLPARYRGLSLTLDKLAAGFETYRRVLRHMAANYMDLISRLSPGEVWHMERTAHAAALPAIKEEALNRMLDAYNRWRAQPGEATRQAFMEASEPYCQLKPGFDPHSLLGGSAN